MSRSRMSAARASRLYSINPREFRFSAQLLRQEEAEYAPDTTMRHLLKSLYSLPESAAWNAMICAMALAAVVVHSMEYVSPETVFGWPLSEAGDLLYNILFFLHVSAHLFNDCYSYHHESKDFRVTLPFWYMVDVASYSHYAALIVDRTPGQDDVPYILKMTCYYARLRRPFSYLWDLNDYHLKGSVVGTLVKYWYIFLVIRVIYANFFIWVGLIKRHKYISAPSWLSYPRGHVFIRAFFFMDCLFLPVGPDMHQTDDYGRMATLMVMISGALLVTGTTIASLALVIGLYMHAEEQFRARFQLIMKDMKETKGNLRSKVETYYRMYWHKQKGVSVTNLLPKYPPSLSNVIYTDIFFEAQQKSLLLRDLSYSFLMELSKRMTTINYIPGDSIIQRGDSKFAIVYISYGDVEMLTADDDETPMLRFTRGSIMNPCGGCAEVAASKAHVSIRAATFCTAHVLKAADLWRVAAKYGQMHRQTDILRTAFFEHLYSVKRHYGARPHPPVKYKSTILLLKRNLMELKEARGEDGKLLLARTDVFLEIAGCYIMRNRKDASLTEEADAICLRPTYPCILQPQSSLIIVWNCFMAIVALCVVMVYPYYLIYFASVSKTFLFYNYLLSFVFVLDIVVHLSTGAKIEEGVPTTFTQTSSQQMKSAWFVLDVLAVAPMFQFIGDGRFIGLNKVIKLTKVFYLLKQLQNIWVNQANILRFICYVLFVLCMCWLVASTQQGFWCFQFKMCRVTNLTHNPFWSQLPLDDGPVRSRFVYSMYWAVSLMYFVVHKTYEASKFAFRNCFFVMIIMEVCTVTHIMVEATYSATIMVTAAMRDQYNICINTVKIFLEMNNVNPSLRHRFIAYLQLCWYTDKAYGITNQKRSILFDLPQHVYKDISAIKRKKFLLSIPFMKYFNKKELRTISSLAAAFYTTPNEILLNTGDMTNEIHIIRQGLCEVIDPDTKKVVSVIGSKTCFGDVECILRLPAYYTVRAVTHVQLFSIARKHLLRPIEDELKMLDAIRYARSLPLYADLIRERREQFVTYEMPAPAPSREFFPLPRKHEPDVAFLMPFMQLGFFSILRYVFPRFTIRPDGPYLRRYEWFRAFCAFLSSLIFPYYTWLELMHPSLMWYISWFLDLTAYFDIFQRMLIGYFNDKGILLYHPASTAAHYLKGAFLLDTAACLPLERLDSVRQSIYSDQHKDCFMHTTQYQILMYNRLLQLYRLPNALDILRDIFDREDIVLVIKAMPLILALMNVLVSLMLELSLEKWIQTGGGWHLKIIRDPVHGSWIEKFSNAVSYNIMESSWTLILTVFYWVTYEITSTGLNLFQPSSLDLMTVLTIGMLLGFMTVTYYSVHVISIRTNVNQTLADYQENMKDIIAYMKRERLSKEIQREIVEHYEYQWDKQGGTDYRRILKLCDQISLRAEAIIHIYGVTFSKCPVLSHCDNSVVRMLGRAVHSVHYRRNTVIISKNEVISNLYFLDYGTIVIKDRRSERHIGDHADTSDTVILTRGSLFGNLVPVTTAVCRSEFVALSNIHLLRMETDRFYSIIADFPSVQVLLKKYRPNNENYVSGGMFDESSMKSRSATNFKSRRQMMPSGSIINTRTKGVQIYLIIVSLLCVYGDIYNICFSDNTRHLILALYVLDVAFFFKILLNIVSPYVTEEETESKSVLVSSRSRYFRGEFKYDIISLMPFELFSYLPIVAGNDSWFVFSLLRMNRLLRVATINTCMSRYYQKLNINLTISTIFSVLTWFTLFVHTATCLWYALGEYEDSQVPKSSWRWKTDGTNTSNCINHYICSFYFVLTCFTQNGVGDILPRQKTEVFFVIILMMCSMMVYMVYVGQFSNIIQYQFFRTFGFYSDYLQLQSFLRNNRVSKNLVDMTNKYTLHLWRETRGLQVPHFLAVAPQTLRLRTMAAAYAHHFYKHPHFRHCEASFLRHLSEKLKPYYYEEDMYVVRECEITGAMYFIHTGQCREILSEDQDESSTPIYNAGEHFGTDQGLHRSMPYHCSFKTVIKSQVLTLAFDDWKYLLPHFPKSRQILYRAKYKDRDSSFIEKIEKKERMANYGTDYSDLGSSRRLDFEKRKTPHADVKNKEKHLTQLSKSATDQGLDKSVSKQLSPGHSKSRLQGASKTKIEPQDEDLIEHKLALPIYESDIRLPTVLREKKEDPDLYSISEYHEDGKERISRSHTLLSLPVEPLGRSLSQRSLTAEIDHEAREIFEKETNLLAIKTSQEEEGSPWPLDSRITDPGKVLPLQNAPVDRNENTVDDKTKTLDSDKSDDDDLFLIRHDDSSEISLKSALEDSKKDEDNKANDSSVDELFLIKHDNESEISLYKKDEAPKSTQSLRGEISTATASPMQRSEILAFRDKVRTVDLVQSEETIKDNSNQKPGLLKDKDQKIHPTARVKIREDLPKINDVTTAESTSGSGEDVSKETELKSSSLTSFADAVSRSPSEISLDFIPKAPSLKDLVDKKVVNNPKNDNDIDEGDYTSTPIVGDSETTTVGSVKSVEEYMLEQKLRRKEPNDSKQDDDEDRADGTLKSDRPSTSNERK